jgi:uncharacterized protein YdeI (YjbR/CyaY-like superfamily)
MTFIQRLITNLNHSPQQLDAKLQSIDSQQNAELAAIAQRTVVVPKEVLKFAPKKMRRPQATEDLIDQLQTEIIQWKDRAVRAETRLRYIEKFIQQITAEHIPGFANLETPRLGRDRARAA